MEYKLLLKMIIQRDVKSSLHVTALLLFCANKIYNNENRRARAWVAKTLYTYIEYPVVSLD